jgi:glucokinase
MKNEIIIGVDLGGTKIMTGAITPEGKTLGAPIKVQTGSEDPKEVILKRITDSIEQTLESLRLDIEQVKGIGIGSTGPLDLEAGSVLECPQLPTMHFFPLRKAVEDHFGTRVYLNNDANCLILGESVFGAAADKKNVIGFTLGTGLGCAIVLNKKIFNGSTGTAAEIWPSPYLSGTIEDYVCGSGVTRIYKSISGLTKTSYDIYNLAFQGDNKALETWKEFGKHLAVPISWSINMLDPDIVVIGGSVTNAYSFFKGSMEENLRKWVCPVPAQKTKVVTARLGDYAGFIGAACLVIENN